MKKQMQCLAGIAVAVVTIMHATAAWGYSDVARKGFFAGGGASFGAETGPFNKFGGGGNVRLGYGVTDNVLLYVDNNYFYTKSSGTTFNFFDSEAKVQYFPIGGFFMAAGGGMAVGKSGVGLGSKVGWTASYTAGWEFRPKEQFALSAEAGFRYRRIGGTNFYSPLGGVRADWFF